MKKIILFFLVVVLFVSCKTKRTDCDYVPLSKFKGDTLAYLTYNFEEKINYYKGLKSSVILEIIKKETPFQTTFDSQSFFENKKNIRKVTEMSLYLGNERTNDLKQTILIVDYDKRDPNLKNKTEYKCGHFYDERYCKDLENCLRNFLSDCKIDKIKADMMLPKTREEVSTALDFLETLSKTSWERGKYCKYEKCDTGVQRIKFTRDSIFMYSDKKAKDLYFSSPYYLAYGNTDKVIKKRFDDSAVGCRSDGCYIVVKVDGYQPEYYRIYELSDKKLRIRSMFNFSHGKLMDFYPSKK